MNFSLRLNAWLVAAVLFMPLAARAAEIDPAGGLRAQLAAKAAEAVRAGKMRDLRELVDRGLKEVLEGEKPLADPARLEVLEHYRNVGLVFDFEADADTKEFIVWLLAQEDLAARFCRALSRTDKPAAAVGVLRALKNVKGVSEKEYLENFEMAIAYALVWDDYAWLYWTGLDAPQGRMEETYKYYLTSDNGRKLRFSPARLPHELLRHMVDHPLSAEERSYAVRKYATRASLGSVFFDVKWIKTAGSMARGKHKSLPYTLPNIKKLGGVCMEQAYYASSVAKVLGVPAVYCHGTGLRGEHAWVGLLRYSGGRYHWDFAAGRYPYDRYWKGETFDPTCRRRTMFDSEVGMSAGVMRLDREDLESADARRNLAVYMLEGMPGPDAPLPWTDGAEEPAPKKVELDEKKRKMVFDLLLSSIDLNIYSRRTWNVIGAAAAEGTFTLVQIQEFSDRLFRTVGKFSGDFCCHTVQKFILAVEDQADRDRLYETCFNYFKGRPDLAAELKVAQGRMWEAEGDTEEALDNYLEAVTSFPYDGHVTQEAAGCIDTLLAKGDPARAVECLKKAWHPMAVTLRDGGPMEREGLKVIGINLIKYMDKAGMKDDLARFEPAFRRMFPEVKIKK